MKVKWFKSELCVVCSAGGHLSEAIDALKMTTLEKFFVTFGEPHVRMMLKDEQVYYVLDPHKSIFKYVLNIIQSFVLVLKTRPKVIFSTGAGIAIATCLFGKLIGSKVIFLESGARITTASMTGRLMYYFADEFIVQWEPLLKHYPNAKYYGSLI